MWQEHGMKPKDFAALDVYERSFLIGSEKAKQEIQKEQEREQRLRAKRK